VTGHHWWLQEAHFAKRLCEVCFLQPLPMWHKLSFSSNGARPTTVVCVVCTDTHLNLSKRLLLSSMLLAASTIKCHMPLRVPAACFMKTPLRAYNSKANVSENAYEEIRPANSKLAINA
jgi:hypothetical protein